MKLPVILLLLSLSVFDFAESGIILDRIKTGISDTRQTVRCGAKKVGGLFTRQEVDCHENTQDTNELGEGNAATDKAPEEQTPKSETGPDTTEEVASETYESAETTEKASTTQKVVPVDDGRRIIGVGGNCPDGQRADVKGVCREEY